MSWVCDSKVRAKTLRVSKMDLWSGLRAWAGDIELWVGQGRGSVMASGGIEARNEKK